MPDNIFNIKSKGQRLFEYFVLTLCLCVMSLRATYTEAINISGGNIWMNVNDNLISLIFTGLLLSCVIGWLICLALKKFTEYRVTSLEFALVLFIIAGFVGINAASNKRAAINDFVTLAVPMLTAVVLTQILDAQWKIKLALVVLVALACASAYQCCGQYFVDTHIMVEQYKTDPQSMLNTLGITSGSFEQWLFEHRLYTKGINGFLLTSNSVASFSILAVFVSIALLAENCKQLYKKNRGLLFILASAAITLFVFSNFIYVRSKGGTAAMVLSLILFVILIRFGKFIKRYRMLLLMLLMILIAFGAGFLISYGAKHNRLPGGNSMLVRWQYWTGAGQMYSDNQITGIGPGNFSSYYTHYKNPAASEVVKDPHNFVLSLLTQYGLLGILAFIAMLFAPLWFFLKYSNNARQKKPDEGQISKIPIIIACLIALVLLVIRPLLKPIDYTSEASVYVLSAAVILYLMPVVVFAIAFAVLWFTTKSAKLTNITICSLLCGYIGVALHNLLDFAIFEPGIYTSFWIVIACVIALQNQNAAKPKLTLNFSRPARFIVTLIALSIAASFSWFTLLPTAGATSSTAKAKRYYDMGFIDQTQQLLKQAARKDKLDPKPLLASGKMYLQFPDRYGKSNPDKSGLLLAEKSFQGAIERNNADFKAYEKLTEVYELLAELSTGEEKTRRLIKAYETSVQTVRRYPNMARIRYKHAQLAELLGKNDIAVENYKKAVEIEDAFREQFIIMYPEYEPISRLGAERYNLAKRKAAF